MRPRQPDPPAAGRESVTAPLVGWLRKAAAYSAAILLVGAVLWFVVSLLLRVGLVSGSVAAAFLVAALLSPFSDWLRARGVPRAIASLASIVVLLGVPLAVGLLIYSRVSVQIEDVQQAMAQGLDDVRTWLIEGPLSLGAEQVTSLRDAAVQGIYSFTPSPMSGARTALRLLSAVALAVFTVFFLLKDGRQMWRWVQSWVPSRHRQKVGSAGEEAWVALRGYVRGIVLVAFVDAVAIGLVLLLLGVPLWVSLSLLTFLGAFVPLLGATVAGLAAVLVTLVTEGGRDAVIVLIAVIVVQQVEGNVLHPVVMGQVIDLHPLAVVLAVTSGAILLGVIGAVIAVPLTAVLYRVARLLRGDRDGDTGPGAAGEERRRPPRGKPGRGSRWPNGLRGSRMMSGPALDDADQHALGPPGSRTAAGGS